MLVPFYDLVKDTTVTTGTGTITLTNSAPQGYRTFASVLSTNDTFYYVIRGQGSTEWEIGIGTLTAATTFTRDTILQSSNSNSAVNFSAGTKDVYLDQPAASIQTNGQDLAMASGVFIN